MMLSSQVCRELHVQNAGKLVWLDYLAANDYRIVLKNDTEILHVFMSAEYDKEEQAQAARICAAVNLQREHYKPIE